MSTREEFERRLTAAEQKVEGKLGLAKKSNDANERLNLEQAKVVEQLRQERDAFERQWTDATKTIKELEDALAKASDDPLIKALRGFVHDETKHIGRLTETIPMGMVDQTLPFVHVKTTIPLRTETRQLPAVSTLTTRGKVVALIRDGKLDAKKRQSEVSQLLPEGIHKLEVMGVLNKLVEEQVLVKIKEDATHVAFMRHPDVEVVKA